MIGRLQSPFRAAQRASSGDRLADCDAKLSLIAGEMEELVDELGDLRDGASPLIEWLAERDVLLEQKEQDLAGVRPLPPERDVPPLDDELPLASLEDALGEPVAAAPVDEPVAAAPVVEAAVALVGERPSLVELEATSGPEWEPAAPVRASAPALGHLRFAPFPEGYRLVASDERCALAGDVVDLEGRRFVVTRVGRSPLPADERPCAFLSSLPT